MEVLCIGDSWLRVSAGGGRAFPELSGFINHGISGSTAKSWARDEGKRVTKALMQPSDVVVVSLGGNDAIRAYNDKKITLFDAIGIIWDINEVISKFIGRRVILIMYTYPPMESVVSRVNKVMRTVGFLNRVETLDTSAFLDESCFEAGNIHPNQKGHFKIAASLEDMLKEPLCYAIA
jgi:lysophospholipase L1-like esterase